MGIHRFSVDCVSDGIHVDSNGNRCRAWARYANARSPNVAGPTWLYGTVIIHHVAEGDELAVPLQTAIRQVREHVEMIGARWTEPCIFMTSHPYSGQLEATPEFKQVAEEEAARLGWRFDDGQPT